MIDFPGAINIAKQAEEYVAKIASLSPFSVEFRGGVVTAVNGLPNHCHVVGDPVRVLLFKDTLLVHATMVTLPTNAIVTAYTAGAANVSVANGNRAFDAQIVGSYSPVAGDRVAILWTAEGPYCLGKRGVIASPPALPLPDDGMNVNTGPDVPVPPPPPTGPVTVTLLAQQIGNFYLSSSGNFTLDQGRYWVYSGYRGGETGEPIDGYWFYGDQMTKIRGVSLTKIEMYFHRATGQGPAGAQWFNLILHNNKTKPSNYNGMIPGDTRNAYFTLSPGQAKWVTLPVGWGQQMAAASPTAAGVGIITVFGSDPYMGLLGIDHPTATLKDANSGAIRVTYTRT